MFPICRKSELPIIFRDYIFILHAQHSEAVDIAIKTMMKSNWHKHFSELNI